MDVMEKAAQGDKQAMRLVEKEYGVGNPQDFAIEQLSVEEFPPGEIVTQRAYDHLKARYPEGTDPEGRGLPYEHWGTGEMVVGRGPLKKEIRRAPTYGPDFDEYRLAAGMQVANFEKELFGEEIDKLQPADQKDLILELYLIDPYAARWANRRVNAVDIDELEWYEYRHPNFDPDDPNVKYWPQYKNTPTNPAIQPVLNYYKEKFGSGVSGPAGRGKQSSSSMHRQR